MLYVERRVSYHHDQCCMRCKRLLLQSASDSQSIMITTEGTLAQRIIWERHNTVVLDAVQNPLLCDTMLSPPSGHLPHDYASCSRARTEISTPTDNQLTQVTTWRSALVTNVHASNIWNWITVTSALWN